MVKEGSRTRQLAKMSRHDAVAQMHSDTMVSNQPRHFHSAILGLA